MFEYAPAPDGTLPGFAIVTGRFVTLFGHDTGADFAGELYSLLEDHEAELPDVLDLLALDGGPPDCGIVEVVDPDARSVHVAVRGAVDVVMNGVASTRFSGPEGGAWVLGDASGIDGLRLTIGRVAADGERLPVQRGVVRTAEISMARVRRPHRRPHGNLRTEPIDLSSIAVGDRRAALVEASVEPHAAEVFADVPEVFVGVAQSDDLDRVATATTVVPPAIAVAAAEWVLRLPDGGEVRPPVVFGRRPSPIAGGGAVHVVTPSPRREISGRHLQVLAVDGALVAVDLASTNGTLVHAVGRAPHLLIHNAQVELSAGDILDVGESYLVTVGETGATRSE